MGAFALKWPIRWIIGFSSTSSLFGYAGQTNYCAANAVLDQLATFGTSELLPSGGRSPCKVLAVNWGAWGEVGMARVGTKAHSQAVAEGDVPLPTATGLACLAAALRMAEQVQHTVAQICVCDVDWSRPQWNKFPILNLLEKNEQQTSTNRAKISDITPQDKLVEVAEITTTPQHNAVQAFFLKNLKSCCSWKSVSNQSLLELGFDSLEIVQLRNSFNRTFSKNIPLNIFSDAGLEMNELLEKLTL